MYDVMNGVKVVEVASHVFVPLSGAVLADWGATVIKVEPPQTGDPYRGLVTQGITRAINGVDVNFKYVNRGKQSIGIDLKKARGRDLLGELLSDADVLLTNQLPKVRTKLGLTIEDVRSINPEIIVARGSGFGQRGSYSNTAGYDSTAYWSRGGVGATLSPADSEWPLGQRPAFGDVIGAITVAGGIAAALYKRAVTGVPSTVDISLMNVGMWQIQPDILTSQFETPGTTRPTFKRGQRNPLTGVYRTKDNRFISLCALNPDPYWREFCETIGIPELANDPRFIDIDVRQANGEACVAILDDIFGSRTYDEWCADFADFSGAWAPMQSAYELHEDLQALDNGYFTEVDLGGGETMRAVSSPVTFDEYKGPKRMVGGPEVGQHTEEILLALNHSWDDMARLKEEGVIN